MYKLSKLPYDYDALEPYIDTETVCIHYTKHLQGYVDKLNKVLEGYEKFTEGKTLEEILYNVEKIPKEIRTDVINQGGGVANHNLYFSILSKKPKKCPNGKLLIEINKKYGDIEKLKDEISKRAINQFGSGYSWLVVDEKGELDVISTSNQDSPISENLIPIIGIDVWEHAYYLQYKNNRAGYIDNRMNVINWDKASKIYSQKQIKS